ncbi:MAG: response regulator [Bacteroidota bacterium]
MLSALARQLHPLYQVSLTPSPEEGLVLLEREGPFSVVLSDMRMPKMDGATFLKHVRERSPDTVRLLLTGHADLESAIAAVNEGQVFRFLTKPCSVQGLMNSLAEAVNQYELVTAERVLLEETLLGSIAALTEILALSNPLLFGRATRAKRLVGEIAGKMELHDRWQIEIAAMLSQLACITLPPQTAEKHYYGQPLEPDEATMVNRLPVITKHLLQKIPRLEPINQLLFQLHHPEVSRQRLGAELLQIVLQYDQLETSGYPSAVAIEELRRLEHHPEMLDHLEAFVSLEAKIEERFLSEIQEGMIFAEDVQANDGKTLVPRGQAATASLLARLTNFAFEVGIPQPIRMIAP